MNIRFYNGLICSMDRDIFDGELWTRGDRVHYCGEYKEQRDIEFDREIDLKGDLLIPGFKNAHTHSAMTFLRSYADDLPLLDWLEHQVFPMEAKLLPEEVYWLCRLAILEYLSSGMTANMDMYSFMREHVKASTDSGFRTVLVGALNNFVGSLQEMEESFDCFDGCNDLISARLGFHAEYTCSPQLLSGIGELVNRRRLPIFMHSSESSREVRECVERTGMSPTAWMASHGIFDFGGGCYHCVHMTDDDLQLMRAKNMSVVTCPGSNVKLASGIARVTQMQELGIEVALGTDGPASNNSLDMFREMFLVTGLQKLRLNDASALAADKVLEMACVTGARVMGLPDCDSLAEGKLADLTVIDLHRPNMQPQNNVVKNLVYSGSKENVRLTMVGGRILYENGEFFVGEDAELIYKNAGRVIERMSRT